MAKLSQEQRILRHLKRGKPLSALTALRQFDCLRLAARIHDLKSKGHNIGMTLRTDPVSGKQYAVYKLLDR